MDGGRVARPRGHVTATSRTFVQAGSSAPLGRYLLASPRGPARAPPSSGAGRWAGKGTGWLKGGRSRTGLSLPARWCPFSPATAEDVPRALVEPGGPDPRGETRGGDARRENGAVPACGQRAPPSWGHPGLCRRRGGRKARALWPGRGRWACVGVVPSVGRGGSWGKAPSPTTAIPTLLLARLPTLYPTSRRGPAPRR